MGDTPESGLKCPPTHGGVVVKLNNRAVDNAKPREKKWKLADADLT